jgi:hypothetical protein
MTAYVRHIFERMIPQEKEMRVRRWAASNAYTLIFVSILFVVQMIVLLMILANEGT